MKVKEVLKKEVNELNKYKIEDAILKVQILLQHTLGVSHEYLITHYEDKIDKSFLREFEKNIVDLINGKPIQYIVNNQVFYGCNFYVDEHVLIPQPDTECLVEEAIRIGEKFGRKIRVLDMCTGSGAIAVSLNKNLNATVFASDISVEALEIARKNTFMNQAEVSFIHSDMFENIHEKFDMIVSNPPYIETETIETLSEEVKSEPIIALDGGKDGLNFYRILANQSRQYLEPDGVLALEIGYNQKNSVIEILKQNGFYDIYSKKDFSNNDRIVVGKLR